LQRNLNLKRSFFVLSASFIFASGLFAQTQIRSIEINQAIGVQKNGALKYVAGKNAVVRAFLDAPVSIDTAATSATITRDGASVATIAPNAYDGPTATVDFLCPSREVCGDWAAGSYAFSVTVNGVTKTSAGTEYNFVERAGIRILAVPVKANYGGQIVPVTDSRWKNFADYVRATFPVAPANLHWIVRDEFDGSGFDLETDEGRFGLWDALTKLMPARCGSDPNGEGCFTQIFGFIMARPKGFPNGTLQGYTYGKPGNIGVITDEDAAATVSHEIGHTYGLGDTYDGGSFACDTNPAPDPFTGKDFNDPSKSVSCTSGRIALGSVSATKIPKEQHPYDVDGRGPLPDMAEYMGSGGLQEQFWTTQDAWDLLFDKLAPAPVTQALRTTAVQPQRFVEFFGRIRSNATGAADVKLEPWWSYEDAANIADTTGKYMVAAVDAAGARLATQAFHPTFDEPGPKGLPPVHLDPAPFEGNIPFPEATAKFQILRDGNVVMEIPVSRNEPVVSNVAPQLAGTQNGKTAITWDATDADSDALHYEVDYDPDSTSSTSAVEVLARDLTAKQLTVDFSHLAGGPHARVYVYATDGLHSGAGQSAEFRVPAKAPEVFVDDALDGAALQPGQEIMLGGNAVDLQDGEVAEENMVWTSNLSGLIGRGSSVMAHLSPGAHRITLTATNNEGITAAKAITIVVSRSARRRSARH
jgi:hypothetical protein